MLKNHQQTGFTLIEMLLYIALSAVVLLALSQFFVLALSVRVKAQSVAEVEQQGTLVLKKIIQVIRNGSAIAVPAIGATSTSLTLAVPTGSKSPTVISQSNGRITITEGAGATEYLTDRHTVVSNLIFSNLSDASARGTVKAQFTLNSLNASSTNQYDYVQTFGGSATLR